MLRTWIILNLLLIPTAQSSRLHPTVPEWAQKEMDDVIASEEAKKKLKKHEGLSLKAYQDVAGVWTVGYGVTGMVEGTKIGPSTKISPEMAEALLEARVAEVADQVTRAVKVPLTQPQFDALVSLVYNIGITQFSRSTLLKKLNKKDYQGAAEQFPRWKYAGGKESIGLLKRRMQEMALFTGKIS